MTSTSSDAVPITERFSRWANQHRKWLFAAPAMAFTAVLICFPIGWTLYLSLTDAKGSVRRPADFIGIANYADVLTDTDRFWPAVARTGVFTFGALALELILGMAIALLLWRTFRGQRWVRVSILLPFVATPVAIAMMWRLIFEPNIGFANRLLGWLGLPPQPWLADPGMTLPTLIFVDVWEFTPMVAIILLAGLSTLPDEPDEAARIDGAGRWTIFRRITLPLLGPTMVLVGILTLSGYFQLFAEPYVMTEGGPLQSTVSVLYLMYEDGFKWWNLGLASAVAFMLFALMFAVTVGFVAVARRRGHA